MTCLSCKISSNTFDPMMELNLDIKVGWKLFDLFLLFCFGELKYLGLFHFEIERAWLVVVLSRLMHLQQGS